MPLPLLLLLSTLMFGVGLVVILTKRHLLFLVIGIELMLHAASLNFVVFSYYEPTQQGQVYILFIMTMAVCEAAVALAIIFKMYTYNQLTDINGLNQLHNTEEAVPFTGDVPVMHGQDNDKAGFA